MTNAPANSTRSPAPISIFKDSALSKMQRDRRLAHGQLASSASMTFVINEQTIEQFVGFESEPTAWFQITQSQIDMFADCTHDHQFIHTDPEAAAKTPFGGTIAHGYLTFSMISFFGREYSPKAENVAHALNYGCDKLRFLAPVKVNDFIRARATTLSVSKRAEKSYLIKSKVTIEIKGGDKPALEAEVLGLVVFQ